MENYWDNLQKRASINLICALDAEIVAKQHCILLSCDKDFPAIFRPKLWKIIKEDSLEIAEGRVQKNIELYQTTKKSKLILSLQNLWSDLFKSGSMTRFGMLLDDPKSALDARESWENDNEDFDLKKQGEKK